MTIKEKYEYYQRAKVDYDEFYQKFKFSSFKTIRANSQLVSEGLDFIFVEYKHMRILVSEEKGISNKFKVLDDNKNIIKYSELDVAMTKKEREKVYQREYQRIYRKKNLERIREKQHAYYLKNKQKILETADRWRKENPIRYKEIRQKWREKNREYINNYQNLRRAGKLHSI